MTILYMLQTFLTLSVCYMLFSLDREYHKVKRERDELAAKVKELRGGPFGPML